jgi:hypothetical protein
MINWDLPLFLVICANCDNGIETKSSLKNYKVWCNSDTHLSWFLETLDRNARHHNLQLKEQKKKKNSLNFFMVEEEKKRV